MIVILYSDFFERNSGHVSFAFCLQQNPHPFTQGRLNAMTKTHQQTKIQNKCSIFYSKAIDFKMFIYYTIKQK